MFVQIPEFPRYLVSESGTVVSTVNGKWRVLKPTVELGYNYYYLTSPTRPRVKVGEHVLVLLAWVGPKPDGHCVDHINSIRNDNRVENLEWVTYQENTQRAWRKGSCETVRKVGDSHYCSKLTNLQAVQALALKGTMTQKEAAKLFGVVKSTITALWQRRSHIHIETYPEFKAYE